jgi:hypothetical protein
VRVADEHMLHGCLFLGRLEKTQATGVDRHGVLDDVRSQIVSGILGRADR